ncbi:MAG TPA: hypothetical protein VFM88_08225 [Vicinamibacteria bacterium]|nr:hypothetical protein [Vicinamibacteria bacterium]
MKVVLAVLLAGTAALSFGDLETRFLELREIHDRRRIAAGRGLRQGAEADRYATLYREVADGLAESDEGALSPDDRRARQAMLRLLGEGTPPEPQALRATPAPAGPPDCSYEPSALAEGQDALERIQERLYACYSRAASDVRFEGASYDRLSVLEMVARADDPARRKAAFLALAPVFRSVNGDGGSKSPYRVMLPLSAARWQAKGSPIDRNLNALGIPPEKLEPWLVAILEAWRDLEPGADLEPWDYEHAGNAAGRSLADALPRERLRPLNDEFYRSLGADVAALNIRYDLDPREGKTAVAFTDFGARPRLRSGGWITGEPWVFATYRVGGLGSLGELLHETGHAIHVAAIRTRPAYADWPDSDTFTEALADLVALEAFEPEWQRRWLGRAASLEDSLWTKYAGIVLDVAWGLFELRLHREPAADPDTVWTGLTSRYLHVRPHPELSWWARRGQLVHSPGYMMNYALGAILVADMRARCRELRGPFTRPDPGYYEWLAERLYRFGLERPSGDVIRDLLGRPPSPDALLADLRRR